MSETRTNELKVTAERVPPVEPEIVLRMPYDVALTLWSILGKVGGDPRTSYSRHTDLLSEALEGVCNGYQQRRLHGALTAEDLPHV